VQSDGKPIYDYFCFGEQKRINEMKTADFKNCLRNTTGEKYHQNAIDAKTKIEQKTLFTVKDDVTADIQLFQNIGENMAFELALKEIGKDKQQLTKINFLNIRNGIDKLKVANIIDDTQSGEGPEIKDAYRTSTLNVLTSDKDDISRDALLQYL